MGSLIFWIIVGIIAGALARAVVPGQARGGWITDLLLGVAGAFVGGWLFVELFNQQSGGWIGSTFVAFIGAVVLLLVGRAISGSRRAV